MKNTFSLLQSCAPIEWAIWLLQKLFGS
uniref:Uncharacterized protein n=1 Tax=Arundo donax TaxID=35708 RepID=A0A0A9CQ82_ARUDO